MRPFRREGGCLRVQQRPITVVCIILLKSSGVLLGKATKCLVTKFSVSVCEGNERTRAISAEGCAENTFTFKLKCSQA